MTYVTTYENRSDYLFVLIEGTESYADAVKFWNDLAEYATGEGHHKILVVDKVEGTLSDTDHFYLSLVVAELFRGRKIAFVDPKEATYEKNKFGETVVVNRGVVAAVFRSEEEAKTWLLSR